MKEEYWKIGGVKYKVVEVKGLIKEYEMLGQIIYDELLIKWEANLYPGLLINHKLLKRYKNKVSRNRGNQKGLGLQLQNKQMVMA